ncbi:ML domain-containing protein [Kitasatospora sp. NPDC127067]|uniref:ML domain-containing protein n=1 Tax=Kitasatospora sp. NPDC127067 TaxID=3347126 RepID=UPI00364D4C28
MSSWSYEEIGSDAHALQIKSIALVPDPPKPGNDLTATLKGVVNEELQKGAYFDVSIKLGLIKLHQKRYDLFDLLRGGDSGSWWKLALDGGNASKPIPRGPVTLKLEGFFPREVPRAKFTIAVRAFTANDDDLAGLNFTFDFSTRPSS